MTWGAPKWPPKPPDARKHPGTAGVLLVCGLRSRSGVPPDHPLDAALEHQFVTLVQHAMAVRDDAAVGLLRFALVGDLDFDTERVAFEHRRDDADLAAEVCHARPVDEAGLHDQAFRERERQGAGCGASFEDRLARDVLHVHEEWFGE